jgi:hypothetical protein
MLIECVLSANESGIAQVRMAAFQEVSATGCLEHPVLIDKTASDPPGTAQFAQIVVIQHTSDYVFHG